VVKKLNWSFSVISLHCFQGGRWRKGDVGRGEEKMERAKGRREVVQRSIGDIFNEKAVQKLAVKKSGNSSNVNLLIFAGQILLLVR
jgi:hypothetical protein